MRISDEDLQQAIDEDIFEGFPGLALLDLRDLRTEIDSLRELRINSQATYDLLLEWLELYGQHTNECAVHDRKPVTGLEPWPPCTCGLAKLLEGK
jgi:hypothetical protein